MTARESIETLSLSAGMLIQSGVSSYTCRPLAKSKQPVNRHEKTLDELLDKVSTARKDLLSPAQLLHLCS